MMENNTQNIPKKRKLINKNFLVEYQIRCFVFVLLLSKQEFYFYLQNFKIFWGKKL